MRHLFFLLPLFSVLLIFFSSCSKEDEFTPDFKYAYFPVDSGHYVAYRVDSIVFNDFTGLVDTFTYQLKEVVTSKFQDNEGRTAHRLERYFRDADSLPWHLGDVWSVIRTDTRAEKVEENMRFIKLVFPPEEEADWKGNRFVSTTQNIEWYDDWTYEITELDEPKTLQGIDYDSTLTIDQVDRENLIEKTFGKEMFAKDVGLIFKELQHLEKQDVTAPWSEAESGFILRYTAIDHGNEGE